MNNLMSSFSRLVQAIALVLALTSSAVATRYYVDPDATGTPHDGSSWNQAFLDLQSALAAATTTGDEVWVAEGVYLPYISQRTDTFTIASGVLVYGGFDGTEGSLASRAGLFSTTILTGDVDGNPDYRLTDVYHVVTIPNGSSGTVLDGFKIEYGNADGTGGHSAGGGITIGGDSGTDVRIENCIIRQNQATASGAGIWAKRTDFTMAFNTIRSNTSFGAGGGMALIECRGFMLNGLVSANRATLTGGGIQMGLKDGDFLVCNVLFRDNFANYGGGVDIGTLNSRTAAFVNCTFAANETFEDLLGAGSVGAGIYITNSGSSVTVDNTVVWDNLAESGMTSVISTIEGPGAAGATVSYSDIETVSVWSGTGNLNSDPLFVSPGTSDYHLGSSSPCLDAGDDSLLPNDLLDFDGDGTSDNIPWELVAGQAREVNDAASDTGVEESGSPTGIVDMGCYERQ